MQSASRHPFGLSYKRHSTRGQVLEGEQAPKSFCWKNPSKDTESPRLKGHSCPNRCHE
jgi:hypothetical protein